MGEVYRAYDSILERDVAIKVMHRHLLDDSGNEARFLREARIVARSVHPNVVTIHEIGKSRSGRYIVMELVQGKSITKILKSEGKLTVERATRLTQQILSGLQHAHSQEILHRDIKGENILVAADDQVKILDFGIATMSQSPGLTAAGDLLGTLEYMAPEQLLGDTLDARCDLYAAGVVLYHILAGRLPFAGETAAAILYKKLNEDPVPPSHYNPEIPLELDQIVLKAINKDRNARWQSADDFAAALNVQQTGSSAIAQTIPAAIVETQPFEDADSVSSVRSIFIGREKELNKLVNTYSQAAHGHGKTIILMGEAGVGKSTLAQHFESYVRQQQAWVLNGACLYQEGMDAYLPFIDAIRSFFSYDSHSLPEQERAGLKQTIRQKAPLLLEFTERFTTTLGSKPTTVENGEIDNGNLNEAISSLLSIVASLRPIVLVIDDLQWADEASLRLFHYLSRYVVKHRILLMGISRTDRYDLMPNGKPGILVDVLARIRREGNFEQINLSRLQREDCNQLVDKTFAPNLFTDDFYASVFVETRGNPFFLTETLKQLQENGSLFFKEGTWYNTREALKVEIPNRVEDVFIRRLSGLNSEDQEVLQVAAVQGYKFDPSLVAKLLDIPKIRVLKILQRIEQDIQIIASTEHGFQFEHPMLRDLLYNDVPVALRREYHSMIATELEGIYGSEFGALAGDVAQHFRRSGNHLKAIPLLLQAGMRAFGLSAYREASLYFEDLLDSVASSRQPLPESDSTLDMYFRLGVCYEECGNREKALSAYSDLLKFAEKAGDIRRQTDALLRIGRIQTKSGEWRMALEQYDRCLQLVSQHHIPNVISRVNNHIGIIHFHKGEFDEALKFFNKSIDTVDCEKGELDQAHALTNIGVIANIRGEHKAAMENYQRALEIYKRQGNRQQDEARIHHNLGMTYADMGECDAALGAFTHCLRLADEVQDRQLHAQTYLNMGKTLVRQNRLDEAQLYVEKALKIFKITDDKLNVAEAYHVFGLVWSDKGDLTSAEKYFKQSIRINQQLEYQEGLAETYKSCTTLYWRMGDMRRAQDFFTKALATYKSLNLDGKIKELEEEFGEFTNTHIRVIDTEVAPVIGNSQPVAIEKVVVEGH